MISLSGTSFFSLILKIREMVLLQKPSTVLKNISCKMSDRVLKKPLNCFYSYSTWILRLEGRLTVNSFKCGKSLRMSKLRLRNCFMGKQTMFNSVISSVHKIKYSIKDYLSNVKEPPVNCEFLHKNFQFLYSKLHQSNLTYLH